MAWLKANQNGKKKSQAIETTITYLEMQKHTHMPSQRPANINTALLTTKNIPLHFYRYLYFHVGIEWKWEMRLRLDDAALSKAIHNPNVEITVLYIDGAPSGFFEINRAKPEATDLAYFGMMRHAYGRGLGKWFLSAAIEASWSNDPPKITVNTCTLDHPAALPLYQKMGYSPYKQAKGRVYPLSENQIANLAVNNGVFSA